MLAGRSAGIKDLRYGNLVEADWAGYDADALLRNTRTSVPLHDGARHFVVLATLTGSHDGIAGDLVGDLLVAPGAPAATPATSSACRSRPSTCIDWPACITSTC